MTDLAKVAERITRHPEAVFSMPAARIQFRKFVEALLKEVVEEANVKGAQAELEAHAKGRLEGQKEGLSSAYRICAEIAENHSKDMANDPVTMFLTDIPIETANRIRSKADEETK